MGYISAKQMGQMKFRLLVFLASKFSVRAIDDTNTTIYRLGFSTTKADMKHQADEFNSDLTPAPAHGCLAKDQSRSDTHPVQVPDGKGNNRAMQALALST
jgi:hypothetical protein